MSTTTVQISPETLRVFLYDGAKQNYDKSYSQLRASVQSVDSGIERLATRIDTFLRGKEKSNLEKINKSIQDNRKRSLDLKEKIRELSQYLTTALTSISKPSPIEDIESSDQTEKLPKRLEVELMKKDVATLEEQIIACLARIEGITKKFESTNTTQHLRTLEPQRISSLDLLSSSRSMSSSSSSSSLSSSSKWIGRSSFSTTPPLSRTPSPTTSSKHYSTMKMLRERDLEEFPTPPRNPWSMRSSLVRSPSGYGLVCPPPLSLSTFSPYSSPKAETRRQLPAPETISPLHSPKKETAKALITKSNSKKQGEHRRSRSNSFESSLGNCIVKIPKKWLKNPTPSSTEKTSIWVHVGAINQFAVIFSIIPDRDTPYSFYENYSKNMESVEKHCNAIIEIIKKEEPIYFPKSNEIMDFLDLEDLLISISKELYKITQNGEIIKVSQIALKTWGETIFDIVDNVERVNEASNNIKFYIQRIKLSSNLIAWKINQYCSTIFPVPLAKLIVEYFGAFETSIIKSIQG